MMDYFMSYGIPEIIRSDNGTQFINAILERLFQALHISHHRTIPYNPQSNGIIERSNREMLKFLRAMIAEGLDPCDWDVALKEIQFLMNTQEHSALGLSPFELVYGREPTDIFDLLHDTSYKKDLRMGNRKSREIAQDYLDRRMRTLLE
ncbi:hypothetical protein ADUPG1_004147, partial [Aduncisulcus paluster]